MSMYVKALVLLLLLSLLSAGIWKLYDAGGDARENEIIRGYAEKEAKLLRDIADARKRAETQIVQDRIVYRDRIQKIREVVTDCTLPDELTSLLRESGVFRH